MKKRGRDLIIALVLMTLLGAVLCFIPLFNILGYESSAAIGVVGGFITAILTARAMSALERGPLTATTEHLQARFGRLFLEHTALLLPPWLLLSLNAMRVVNCDYSTGLLFFLLIALPAVLLSQMAAWVVSGVVRKTWARALAACAVLLGNGLALGWHVATQPPINGHQWLIGYLSGSIYDEALSIPPSLLWYRAMNIAGVMALLWALEVARRWLRDGSFSPGYTRRLIVLTVVMSCVWGGMSWVQQDFGVKIDRETIAKKLGGRAETEHFIIHYPLKRAYIEKLPLLIEDHEFRYAEMKAYFGTDPVALHGRKVHSFVYPDTETKGDLMGARRTLIAKIWLREIHIIWRDYGDHLLAHELAHVFTEPFGAGPLKLSMQNGVGVNMGLVEGIATAADWPASELPPHVASAAMRRLGIAPDIRGLVGAGGFWTQSSGRAYTLMGSFVRFLVATYGIEKFKVAYRGGDFEEAYGKPADTLVSEWEAFIDAMEVDEDLLELANYYYKRPSIFGKVCARTIAEMRRQASIAEDSGDTTLALSLRDEILDFDPRNTRYQLERAELLVSADRDEEALERLSALLENEELVPSERVQLEHLRADIYWRRGELRRAAEVYAECEAVGVPEVTRRQLQVKRALLAPKYDRTRDLARGYLLDKPRSDVALYFPMRWMMKTPDDTLAAYLAARRLWGADLHREARELMPPVGTKLPSKELDLELKYMHATSLYHTGDLDEASRLFKELAESDSSRLKTKSREWLARVAWKRQE